MNVDSTQPEHIRDAYLTNLNAGFEQFRCGCVVARIGYTAVDTRGPLDAALSEFVLMRSSIRKRSAATARL